MSEAVLDLDARVEHPSVIRVLWAVLVGYFCASVTLGIAAFGLEALGLLPKPYLRPGPYAITGAWSLDADFAVAAAVILVATWWIRRTVADATGERVSFGVVALAVAVTGYAPFLALRPVGISGLLALPATTWAVRRYAVGRSLPIPHPSRRVWAALALAGFLGVGSYQVYHPLISDGIGVGDGTAGRFRVLDISNHGFADMTILRVEGGTLGLPWERLHFPRVLHGRDSTEVYVSGACRPRTVTVTYVLLGRTSTQQFSVQPESCNR